MILGEMSRRRMDIEIMACRQREYFDQIDRRWHEQQKQYDKRRQLEAAVERMRTRR